MNLYAFFYKPGPNWQNGVEIWDQNLLEHGKYMSSLEALGKLFLGGPFTDSSGGMAILYLDSLNEARDVLAQDPAVKSGILTGQTTEWFIAFKNLESLNGKS